MNRGRVGNVLICLCLTILLIGISRGAAHAQTKLVKPLSGGTLQITKSGSYFFGSNFVSALKNSPVISVAPGVNNVTINLNGFSIIGPGVAGTGAGIKAPTNSGIIVVNGTITKIPGNAVVVGSNSTVAGMQIIGNAGDGVQCSSNCLVNSNIVTNNTGTGLNFVDGSSGYQNNIISGNGTNVTGGTNMGHNVCGTSLCP